MLRNLSKKLFLEIPKIKDIVQEREQLRVHCETLIQEREQLQVHCETLIQEREQLRVQCETSIQEKEQFQVHCETLIQEREQLRVQYETVSEEQKLGKHYLLMKEQERLIETDYPYFPKCREWQNNRAIIKLTEKISNNNQNYKELLDKFSKYEEFFLRIPVHQNDNLIEPNWVNSWFPGLDAITLYGLLVEVQPRYYIEVGSGNSTKFARKAINDHQLKTKIISIDPYPRSEIDSICDNIIRMPLEQVSYNFFENLGQDDMLFIDNSHRSFPNSDVTVFFMEILATLPPKMIYGIHDIFLPKDYPYQWLDRYYNEQYLLASYLMGGANGDEILLPNGYITEQKNLINSLDNIFLNPLLCGIEPWGGIFWMQRSHNGVA
jgi:predicted RNA-binding protein YlqC (UPF0109 family)